MWHLTTHIPDDCIVAISGGADSVAILHFISRSRKKVSAAIFDHGTGLHSTTFPMVKELCDKLGIELFVGTISDIDHGKKSPEEHWRDERYKWLESFNKPIITGHNLDDNIETYLWSFANGNAKFIPNIRNDIVYRPFLAVSHQEMVDYCVKNNLQYHDDPSNKDEKYTRSKVRYGLKPEIEKINPGFRNMIKRKILSGKDNIS